MGGRDNAEILLDRGQGHVHDRDIEHDHELRPRTSVPGRFLCWSGAALIATMNSFSISMSACAVR
jgi:hypothetical protein